MIIRHASGPARRRAARAGLMLVTLALATLGAFAHPPSVAAAARAVPAWWSMGVLAGSMRPDGDFADYQWRTSPRAAWGVQALAGRDGSRGGCACGTARA